METIEKEKDHSENSQTEPSEEMGMEELLALEKSSAEGEPEQSGILMAKVVSIVKDGALIDIGRKAEALVPKIEYGNNPPFAVGDTIPVIVTRSQIQGYVKASWHAAKERMAWEEIKEACQRKIPVQVKVKKEIKGGLTVQCENGLHGFIPASQIDVKPVPAHDLKKWHGRTFYAYVMEADPRKNNLVLTRKVWLSEENQKKRSETLAVLKEGDVRKGIVTGLTSFGAFVDIGGVEGLLHIGEIDWAHVTKVSKILKAGQTIEVKVIKFDPETAKISLSRKVLLPHPWEKVEEKFPAGSIVQGKVISSTDFGVFVEIAPGVEGLVHLSEISWKTEDVKPKELFKIGQNVQVKILSVNREKEKISLSIKRLGESPWYELRKKYQPGSVVSVKITSLTSFGAFASLPEGMEGLIHISDFFWLKRVNRVEDVLKVGQEVQVKVLEIDPKKEKISFGLKQLKPNPFEIYTKGKKIKGKIIQIQEAGALLEIEPDVEGFIPFSEISSDRFDKMSDVLSVGQETEAKVIQVEPKERKIVLSIKQFERDLQRAVTAKYSGKTRGPALKDLFE